MREETPAIACTLDGTTMADRLSRMQAAPRSVVLTISSPPEGLDAGAWIFAQLLPTNGEQRPKQACGCEVERVCG